MSDLTRPTTPRSDSWKRDFPSVVDLWGSDPDFAKNENGRTITSDYDRGAEAMRAACIAAVEAECRIRGIPAAPLTLDLLAVLREVQP